MGFVLLKREIHIERPAGDEAGRSIWYLDEPITHEGQAASYLVQYIDYGYEGLFLSADGEVLLSEQPLWENTAGEETERPDWLDAFQETQRRSR
ncbi:hypothetical protein SAMN04487785_11013 [Dyella jiangningensis]|uniref:hypothetical protein n=1 Tax=Dyella sp. AtDHG13 TaxID=1938897 RepID=UPI0008881CC8|nr:hypothetical protein [Dyella sp. AtDHG13]PXV56021.1 hypothetical protein BDW41_10912 [Dyella sp. AtDHG13]SDK68658.1 hypothetical protein SAMN04487785_11013 [Dyella jiangningensis]